MTVEQLAAAQARILELRAALKTTSMNCVDDFIAAGGLQIADMPDDDTALRKLIAKHVRARAVSAAAFYYADKLEDGSAPL